MSKKPEEVQTFWFKDNVEKKLKTKTVEKNYE